MADYRVSNDSGDVVVVSLSRRFLNILSGFADDPWCFHMEQLRALCEEYFKDAKARKVPYVAYADYMHLRDFIYHPRNQDDDTVYVSIAVGVKDDNTMILGNAHTGNVRLITLPDEFNNYLTTYDQSWSIDPDCEMAAKAYETPSPCGSVALPPVEPTSSKYFVRKSDEPIPLGAEPNDHIYETDTGKMWVLDQNGRPHCVADNKQEEKENEPTMKMPMNTNFDFGPVTNGRVALSPYGLAVMHNNEWHAYNVATGQTVDVTGFVFEAADFIYKVPVAVNAIRPGDMILHNGNPVYVKSVGGSKVEVVDLIESEEKNVIPVTNIFNFNFVTKVVSLINLGDAKPSADQPFGNIMPMMLLSHIFDKDASGNDDLMKMMFVTSMMNNNSQNPFGNIFNFGGGQPVESNQ